MSGAMEIAGQLKKQEHRVAAVSRPELQSPPNFSRRIPELDGLRGLAIAMVVFVHYVTVANVARPPQLLGYLNVMARPFWSAVDLFFILSGFLIGGNLLDARDSPNYFSTFYIRRFCRVLPVYFLFLGLVALAYRFVYRPVSAPLDWIFAGRLPWYSYFSFAQNLWMAKWNSGGATILGITWAFAVEAQFYFVVPFLIRFVRRSALPYVFVAGIVLAPLLRVFIVLRFPTKWLATYVLLPSRMDSLFFGLLCAYFLRQPGVWTWLVEHRKRLWMACFLLLAGIPALATKAIPFTFLWVTVGYGWFAMLYSTMMFLALTDTRSLLSRALRPKWLTGLGTISYGVYLFHAGINGLCVWMFTGHGWPLSSWKDFGPTLFALVTTIGVGTVSWHYFEKPIVRWSHGWKYASAIQDVPAARGENLPATEPNGIHEVLGPSQPVQVRSSFPVRG
jgi:peptidoglycan/LPS O-acetylase OafA/YrhL